jgi:hypothetical protein
MVLASRRSRAGVPVMTLCRAQNLNGVQFSFYLKVSSCEICT